MTSDVAPPWPESTILAAAQARFEALVGEHRGIVYKIAHAYVRDAEDRRDLAQQIVTEATFSE